MSWRTVIVSKPSKLDYSMGYMVVRDIDSIVKVHISEINILIIENTASSITCALLSQLVNAKVKVIFCNKERNPESELTAYYGSYDCSNRLKAQINWDNYVKKQIWTKIVEEKIRKQAQVLKKYNLYQYEILQDYIKEIELNDITNREGHAAKVYFNALFGMEFSRKQDNPTNAALNYGYIIILSAFNREIVSNGCTTQLGIFHDNVYNKYNLGSDLMEPFRPYVDDVVKQLDNTYFGKLEKIEIIKLLYREVVIDGRKQTILNAIKIYTKSVIKALDENDIKQIRFVEDEL